MLQTLAHLIGIILILINSNEAQLDQRVCSDPTPSPGIDSNWRPIPSRFEIITELIAEDGLMELSQAFSSTRDSIITESFQGGLVQFYWDFNTNEKFIIGTIQSDQLKIPTCFREILTSQSKTSIISETSLIVKPSILFGYNERNQINPNWNINLIGNGQLRGIPTNIFKSCFYINNIDATISAIYHVSDNTKFQTYLSAGEPIILQIDVNITKLNSKIETYSYNVFRYISNPSRREERQALETPSGVYCPNRTLTKEFPSNIPDRISLNGETFTFSRYNNRIISQHNLYDEEFQFTRFDLYYPDSLGGSTLYHNTQLHDFAVGLSYHYNNTNHQCTVSDIDTSYSDAVIVDNTNLVQMGNPQHLYSMDNMTYQYTGEKQCRDRVWCHVWIGEKTIDNNTIIHREWYWASRINDEELIQWIPMKLISKESLAGSVSSSFELNIFNYRPNPFTILEVDYTLADCYRSLGPSENFNFAVLSFKIINDKNYPVLQNLNYLRLHIYETLIFAMFIRPIRISHIIVDKDDYDILVTFTLLDAPPRTGPVEYPLHESSLDTIIQRLNYIINANNLIFRAKYSNKQVHLRARNNSLYVMYSSLNQNNNQCNEQIITEEDDPIQCPPTATILNQNIEIIYKNSGPLIMGLWIGFIILGVLVGNIAGFFLLKRFSN